MFFYGGKATRQKILFSPSCMISLGDIDLLTLVNASVVGFFSAFIKPLSCSLSLSKYWLDKGKDGRWSNHVSHGHVTWRRFGLDEWRKKHNVGTNTTCPNLPKLSHINLLLNLTEVKNTMQIPVLLYCTSIVELNFPNSACNFNSRDSFLAHRLFKGVTFTLKWNSINQWFYRWFL